MSNQKNLDTQVSELRRIYNLSYAQMNWCVDETLVRFKENTTADHIENFIKANLDKLQNKDTQEQPIETEEVRFGNTSDTTEVSNDVFEIDEVVEDDGLQISDTVKLPNTDYCQKYWGTSQTNIVVPSKHINATKKPPISTLIGASAMSGKEGNYTIDFSGKGARIMNVKRINKLTEKLIETRKMKTSTVNSHIRKLLKLKTKEFEYVTLVNPNNKQEEGYYRLDYSDGFVQMDIRVMHYMFTCYSDNMIQAYIILMWTCREGWSQLTQEQLAEHLGLSKHSYRQAKMILDKLVMDGFIEQRKQYKTVQVVDKLTGIPKGVPMPYYEYKVVNINEYIN